MPADDTHGGRRTVMVELVVPPVTAPLSQIALGRHLPGFEVDQSFDPVPMAGGPGGTGPTVIIRGTAEEDSLERIESLPEVVRVWPDAEVQPMGGPGPP